MRILALLLLSTTFLLFVACSAKKDRTAVILSVNDMHATLDNFPRFAFIVDSLRNIYPDLLLVSGGDNQTGNPINDQYPERGMPMIELMNALRFNLSAIGNHEFDLKQDGLRNTLQKADFDFICANIKLPGEGSFHIKPYVNLQLPNGLKLAFTSVLDINKSGIPDSHPLNLTGFEFESPFKTAQEFLFLRDSADIFIYLNHFGFENDVELANQFPKNTVDLIIGAHSHTKVEAEQIHNGILITQADARLTYATLIQLSLQTDGKITKTMQLLPVGKVGAEDAHIRSLVNTFNNNPIMNTPIATVESDFSSPEQIGYLMADALRAGTSADIALVNSGGVRLGFLPQGNLLLKQVYSMDPFGNEIVHFNLTANELHSLFLAAYKREERGPIIPSGMKATYIFREDKSLKDIELFFDDGSPLATNKTYNVVMNSYMASVYQFDHTDPGVGLAQQTAENMIEYLRKLKNIPDYSQEKRVELIEL